MKKNCPFCDINTQKTRTFRESAHSFVFLSNPRLMPGHTLVAPKRHVEEPWQLTAAELQDIFQNIHWVEAKLLASGLATGCDVRQNYRPFLVQGRLKVDHVHFHILPRTFQDELYEKSMRFETDMFQDMTERERELVLQIFTEQLPKVPGKA